MKKSPWISVKEKLPRNGQRVIAIYSGVYIHRLVNFWKDCGDNPHFGYPDESDGKGSQPATHWMPLEKLP